MPESGEARYSTKVDDGLLRVRVAEAYARFGHLVRKRCKAILRDDALAEDALHDVFARILSSEVSLEIEEPLRMLYVVATRIAIDHQRRAKRKPNGEELFDETLAAPSNDCDLWSGLRRLFETMTDDERTLSILVFRDGFTQEEAADSLGVSRVTVNKRIQGIRERARTALPH